jgi:Zn-dependent protease
MVAHEYAHGYAALRQGDSTALQLGRLTWNPLKHIDPFLTVILPLMTFFAGGFIFGGAKPVPVVPRNFRNYKRGDIIVSLAGVAANAALVVAFTLLMIPVGMLGQSIAGLTGAAAITQQMLRWGIFFNLILIFFNLLPIPPLDGSHVFKYLLPTGWRAAYQQVGRYGLLILVLLLTVGRDVLYTWMSPISSVLRFALRIVFPYMLPGVA